MQNETQKRSRWKSSSLWMIIFILLLSAFLNFWKIGEQGYGNAYYAAAVKSMLQSWHNFFFVSFDPGGFITIDKPPVGFWLQALSAWLFGFHGWSLMLPEGLAGIASTWLVYIICKRFFRTSAALLAALVYALTPLSVAVNRSNEIDGVMVCALLAATWLLVRAVDEKRVRCLIFSAIMVGVAFNIKMIEAYLVIPGFIVYYCVAARTDWKRKLVHLGLAAVALVVVSFSWAIAVDATPKADRPYVGSTQDNSEISLIFGYNGVDRVEGSGFPGGGAGGFGEGHSFRGDGAYGGFGSRHGGGSGYSGQGSGSGNWGSGTSSQNANPSGGSGNWGTGNWGGDGQSQNPAQQNGGNGGAGGFPYSRNDFAGKGYGGFNPGGFQRTQGPLAWLRLFSAADAGQISWFIPLALIGAVVMLWKVRLRRPLEPSEKGAVLWAACLLPMLVLFSVTNVLHTYYMITMAPAIAALTGAGLVAMWSAAKVSWRKALPLIIGVILTVIVAFRELGTTRGLTSSLGIVVIVSLVVAAAAFILFKSRYDEYKTTRGAERIAVVFGLIALLAAPAYWAYSPVAFGESGSSPAANPTSSQQGRMGPGASWNGSTDTMAATNPKMVQYLLNHYKTGDYLVATENADTAAPLILNTGLPVMAMGGFLGTDPALSLSQLESLTSEGKLTYFLVPEKSKTAENQGGAFFGRQSGAQAQVMNWIYQHCRQVPDNEWGGSTASSVETTPMSMFTGRGEGMSLYEYVK